MCDMDEDTGNFDEIWTFVEQKLKNTVPTYIKHILNYCGYNNGISIATIEDEDIGYFISEVRNGNVSHHFGKKNALEGSTKSVENFEFSRGHLKYLMHIVMFLKKYIQENGTIFTIEVDTKTKLRNSIHGSKVTMPKLSHVSMKSHTKNKKYFASPLHQPSTSTKMSNDMDKHKNILLQKMLESLKFHTPKLNAENKSKIEEKMAADQLVIVKMGESKDNPESEDSTKIPKPKASMCCPYCSKSIKVFYESSWKSTNFDRHLYLIHYEEPPGTSTEAVKIGCQSDEIRDKPEDISTDAKATDKISNTNVTNMADVIVLDSNAVDASKNVEIDSNVITLHTKTDATDETAAIDDKRSEATVSNINEKSKIVVSDSEYNVDEQMQEKNKLCCCQARSNKNVEFDQSKIPGSNTDDPDRNNDNSNEICDSFILPKIGDFVILSTVHENLEKWPENSPSIKRCVGQVDRVKDNISKIRGHVDINILKKSRYSNYIFTNAETKDVVTIPTNGILNILQAPSKNRRGEYVFKDKSLLDNI